MRHMIILFRLVKKNAILFSNSGSRSDARSWRANSLTSGSNEKTRMADDKI